MIPRPVQIAPHVSLIDNGAWQALHCDLCPVALHGYPGRPIVGDARERYLHEHRHAPPTRPPGVVVVTLDPEGQCR